MRLALTFVYLFVLFLSFSCTYSKHVLLYFTSFVCEVTSFIQFYFTFAQGQIVQILGQFWDLQAALVLLNWFSIVHLFLICPVNYVHVFSFRGLHQPRHKLPLFDSGYLTAVPAVQVKIS